MKENITRIRNVSLTLIILSLLGPSFILCSIFAFFYMSTYNIKHSAEVNMGYTICIIWICIGIGISMTLLFTIPNISLGVGFLILFIPVCIVISWSIKVSNAKDPVLAWEYIIFYHSYSSYDGKTISWSDRIHDEDIVFDPNSIITGDHYQPDLYSGCQNYDHPFICKCCNRKYNCPYRRD